MKLQFILACLIFTTAFTSCKKCETCVPHTYKSGVVGAADANAETVKLCDERDIKSYESLTNFTDAVSVTDTVRFICN